MKKGQIVRIKSGGPLMTVERILTDKNYDKFVYAIHFEGNNLFKGSFPEEVLEVVEPTEETALPVAADSDEVPF